MESSAARKSEALRPEVDELADAQAMAEWFPDYLYGVINELPELSEQVSERIQQLFGEGDTETQMDIVRNSIAVFSQEEQEALALYFCGYPDAALEIFISPDVEFEKTLERFKETIEPYVVKNVDHAVVQLRAVRELDNETPFDDEIAPLQEDTAREQLKGITPTEDIVHDYLRTIGRYQLLTAEEEVTLQKEIEAGLFAQERLENEGYSSDTEKRELEYVAQVGKRSKEKMVNANLRLAVSIAKKYRGRGMSFIDLIQEGNKGLIRAVEMFDYQKGYKFSTYGTWWIRQQITRALGDTGRDIRIPVHVGETIKAIQKAHGMLSIELSREPTLEELAEETNLSPEKVTQLLSADRQSKTISLNIPMGEEDEAEFGDFIPDRSLSVSDQVQGQIIKEERRVFVEKMMHDLPERDARVVRLRFGLGKGALKPMTLDEVAYEFGVTKERIRQIESRAFETIRKKASRLTDQPALLFDD